MISKNNKMSSEMESLIAIFLIAVFLLLFPAIVQLFFRNLHIF